MGILSKIKSGAKTRVREFKEERRERSAIDKEAREVETLHRRDAYRRAKLAQAKTRGENKGRENARPHYYLNQAIHTGKTVAHAGKSIMAGMPTLANPSDPFFTGLNDRPRHPQKTKRRNMDNYFDNLP